MSTSGLSASTGAEDVLASVIDQNDPQSLKQRLIRMRQTVVQELDSFVEHVDTLSDQAKSTSESRRLAHFGSSVSSPPSAVPAKLRTWVPSEKKFWPRESMLTRMLNERAEVRTIYNACVACMLVFLFNILLQQYLNSGEIASLFELDLFVYAFGKIGTVALVWTAMFSSTFVVFGLNLLWRQGNLPTWLYSSLYVAYQVGILIYAAMEVSRHQLPIGSAFIILCEQTRLTMKTHSYVRETFKMREMEKENNGSIASQLDASDRANRQLLKNASAQISAYLYFLFAPTLIYRNAYPRTVRIRRRIVLLHLGEGIGCVFYFFVIFKTFCIPEFAATARQPGDLRVLLISILRNCIPGIMVYLLAFFGMLHCWLNMWAELMRFADRQFYEDWWTAASFSTYYRKWNGVVHDWLYSYLFVDPIRWGTSKTAAMFITFLYSAVIHEHILAFAFHFFFPVLFVLFAGAGVSFIYLTKLGKGAKGWNFFLWASLLIGNSINIVLYSREWYARFGGTSATSSLEGNQTASTLDWWPPASLRPFLNSQP